MGKNGSKNKSSNVLPSSQASISLREESTGKKQTNVNAKTMLKLEHIKNLIVWASGGVLIPSLGAFFGHRLVASTEALGIQPDRSLFTCKSLAIIAQSELKKSEQKYGVDARNPIIPHKTMWFTTTIYVPEYDIVAKCSLLDGKMNEVNKTSVAEAEFASAVVPKVDLVVPGDDPVTKTVAGPLARLGSMLEGRKKNEVKTAEDVSTVVPNVDLVVPKGDLVTKSPATPLVKPSSTLLEAKKKKKNRSRSKKASYSESGSARVDEEKVVVNMSSKRKRKLWTSLKEIVESSEQNNTRNSKNLTVPFLL